MSTEPRPDGEESTTLDAVVPRRVVPVIGRGPLFEELHSEATRILADLCEVRPFPDAETTARWMRTSAEELPEDEHGNVEEELLAGPVEVPIVIQMAGGDRSNDLMRTIAAAPGGEGAGLVLITDQEIHNDVHWVVNNDKLEGVVAAPWTEGRLERMLTNHVRRALREADARAAAALPDAAAADSPTSHATLPSPGVPSPGSAAEVVQSKLLRNLTLSTQDVSRELLEALEGVLGTRPRLHLPPDVSIIHEDSEVNGVLLVLEGRVAMSIRSRAGEVLLHHASTGPVVGLLSMADGERAFVTARTTTAAEVVHLTIEQLDRALRESFEVGAALTAMSIRVLSARLRRAQHLHVEKYELAAELEAERARLADALAALERARTQLVAQARFATLGELSAGIAHELNNPIAAVARAADHLHQDVERLLALHPQGELLTQAVERARTAQHASTSQERTWRREVEAQVGDRELARRLVNIGVHDAAGVRELLGKPSRFSRSSGPLSKDAAQRLELIEVAAGIGTSLRSMELASGHVLSLVGALKSHARPDATDPVPVDVDTSVSHAVRLTGHRLKEVEVEWHLDTDLPQVLGQPSALSQVWTNLLVNAVDAMGPVDHPRLEIHVGLDEDAGEQVVRVQIVDNGPGIEEENLERIFQPRFTTKHGTVRYGLGMGLGISRRIVEDHGGTITAESEPGRTVMQVDLPVAPAEHLEVAARAAENPAENLAGNPAAPLPDTLPAGHPGETATEPPESKETES